MSESKQLTKHFNLSEFHTHDGTEVPESHERAVTRICLRILEPMREQFGPCRVVSGYRHHAYNARIGGARFSFHVYDEHAPVEVACDVTFARGNVDQWRKAAIRLLDDKYGKSRGGIGRYPRGNFIHIDTRKTGRAYWEGS